MCWYFFLLENKEPSKSKPEPKESKEPSEVENQEKRPSEEPKEKETPKKQPEKESKLAEDKPAPPSKKDSSAKPLPPTTPAPAPGSREERRVRNISLDKLTMV